jgi:hypothetical protein
MFGNQNGNAGSANDCLTFANVAAGSACIVSSGVGVFASSANPLMFGPLPAAATISNLLAVTGNSAAGQTITVLDDTTATTLTCTTTVASPQSCSDSSDSVVIPAGDFLQVEVGNGAGAWRVTFQLS